MPHQDAPLHRYGILLVPGFSSLAITLVTEPLFIANWLAGRSLFSWTTLSADGFAVRSSSGNLTAVDAPLAGDPQAEFDTVFVVASFDVRALAEKSRLIDWLRKASRTGVRIGAVEIGSEILMEAGLLRETDIPVHWYNAKGSAERFPELRINETLFRTEGKYPLSAGGMATVDMMLELIAQEAGDGMAEEIGKHLLLDQRRPGSRPQSYAGENLPPGAGTRNHDPVARAHKVMEGQLDEPISCAALAEMAGVSARHLQRLFKARLGRGVEATYRELRLAKAHQLVQQTDTSLTEIAAACGFSSLEVFSRTYRRRFGVAPSRDRRQSLGTTVYHRIA